MQSSKFTFSMDVEPPDFDLPPGVAVLPTPELRLLALLYLGHKGIMPEQTPIKVSDRIRSAEV